jgi:hypothetical protein
MVIILAKKLLGKRINAQLSVEIIKWVLFGYSVLSLGYTLALVISSYLGIDNYIINRATGPYWWAYWFMFSGTCIFPLFLLIPRLGRNMYVILLATFLVNIGWLLGSLTIHTASMQRDYVTETNPYLPYMHEWFILLRGFIVGLFIAGIGFCWKARLNKAL